MSPTETEMQVLRAVVDYHTERGVPPSNEEVAEQSGVNVNSVRTALYSLGALGLLTRNHRGARCWVPTDEGRAAL